MRKRQQCSTKPALFALAAFLLAFCTGHAQDLRYLSHQSWSTEQGLPQSSVHSITQTADGYLWFATEAGLVRFDATNFRIYDHTSEPAFPSDDICCLAPAPNNTLLIGTAEGTLQYANHHFHRLNQPAPSPPTTLTGPNDALWSWTSQTLTLSQHGSTHTWQTGQTLPSGRIQTLSIDREGLAWIGMNDGLLIVNPIALDSEVSAPKPVLALGSNSILSLYQDTEGNHWIGTETSGLHILRNVRFRSEPSLADKAITSIAQTTDTSLWIGTRDEGLYRIRSGITSQPIPAAQLTSAVILCLAPAAHGGLWVGTPDGLTFISPSNKTQRLTSANGLPDDYIRSLASDPDGSLWIGTRQGLVHLRGSASQPHLDLLTDTALANGLIGAILPTAHNGLWVATAHGLSILQPNGHTTHLDTPILTALAQDPQGRLWAATANGTLTLWDGHTLHPIASLPPQPNTIAAITPDHHGRLWLRLDRGIRSLSLDGCTLTHCTLPAGALTTFGPPDGLPSNELVTGIPPTPLLLSNGELWFPTRGGVAIVDTDLAQHQQLTPPIVLERFLVDDIPQDLSNRSPAIAFGHQRLTLEYAALNFTAPTEVRYRFQLSGFDKTWTEAGTRRSASYTNLPPGTYDFRVEAMNPNGLWSDSAAHLHFRIIPPFYRRWWFITLALLVLIALLAALYLLRLQRLRRQFDAVLAERNRMAREIHDTLTQDFVGTSLQLDLIAQQLTRGKIDAAIDQVKRTRQLVTDGLDEARRSIWELRANNAQDSLPTRLTRLTQRDLFTPIAPRLHVSGAYRELDPRTEREILRITQEALTNVLRHAHAASASVELHYSSDTLMLTIADNGSGFSLEDAAARSGHFGLVGMKERAAAIDGTLDVASKLGAGTTITLRVPTPPGTR
jgi:signal transduction histidine kinase/ligand-binding sensor domain-containing protein